MGCCHRVQQQKTPWKVDARHQVGVRDDTRARPLERLRDELPDNQPCQHKYGVRRPVRRHARKHAEDDSEDKSEEQRLQDGPGDADHRLLITYLQSPPHENDEQMPEAPKFRQVQRRALLNGPNNCLFRCLADRAHVAKAISSSGSASNLIVLTSSNERQSWNAAL